MRPMLMTRLGLEKLWAELASLRLQLADQNRSMAQAFEAGGGSWHDNATWEHAQLEQSKLRGRVAELETLIGNAKLIEDMEIDTSKVQPGTVTRVKGLGAPEAETSITILGVPDVHPDLYIISYLAPLAKAILGKKVGAKAKFNGDELTILAIARWQPISPELP